MKKSLRQTHVIKKQIQTMKISTTTCTTTFALLAISTVSAFTVTQVKLQQQQQQKQQQQQSASSLKAIQDNRRIFLKNAASVAVLSSGAFALPLPSYAEYVYVPKFEDMKQIVNLGYSLDKLVEKLSDEATVGEALTGLVAFNRDGNFYTTYARNFVGKSVKNNANGDPRVGNMRQASSLISSCQELLEGRQGLLGKEAADEVGAIACCMIVVGFMYICMYVCIVLIELIVLPYEIKKEITYCLYFIYDLHHACIIHVFTFSRL